MASSKYPRSSVFISGHHNKALFSTKTLKIAIGRR